MIDLSSYIDNSKLKNAKKLSDRQLFGIVTKTKLTKLSSIKQSGKDVILLQKSIPNDDESQSNRMPFQQNYVRSIFSLNDPGLMIKPLKNETSGDSRKRNTFPTRRRDEDSISNLSLQSSMRNIVETSGNFKFSEQSTSKKAKSTNDTVAIEVDLVDRNKLICYKFDIKSSQLKSRDIFYITLELLATNNTIVQSINLKILHRQNINNYYIPKSLPIVRIAKPLNTNKSQLRFSLSKTDKSLKGAEIYARKINQTQNLLAYNFSRIKSFSFKNKDSQYADSFSVKYSQDNQAYTIARLLPIGKTGEVYGNFTSSVIAPSVFSQNYATLTAVSNSKGIELKAIDYPSTAIAISFVKRNLTKKEREYKDILLLGGKVIDKNEKVASSQFQGKKIFVLSSKNKQSIVVQDNDVLSDNVYEYKMKIQFKNGTAKLSQSSADERFIKSLNIVSMSTTNIKYDAKNGVSFNLSYTLKEMNSSILLDALRSLGLSSLYSDDIEQMKISLKSLIIFDVERQNIVTTEIARLGLFQSGKIVDNNPSQKVQAGQLYAYNISAFIMSPDNTLSEINRLRGSIKDTSDNRSPRSFSSQRSQASTNDRKRTNTAERNEDNFSREKSVKNLSRGALTRGTLASSESSSNRSINDVLKNSPTGDSTRININTGLKDFSVLSKSISLGSQNGAVLRWSIKELQSGSSKLDYFIVMSRKQGRNVVAGSCHFIDSGKCAYIDYLNTEFVGDIQYSVIPVFLDGKLGTSISIGNITQIDRNTAFKKGR